MPIVVVGVSISVFLARNLTTFWSEYNQKSALIRACNNELDKDLRLLKTEKGFTDYGERFIPTKWNVDTYKQVLHFILTEQIQVSYRYEDLENLVAVMEQDNIFQTEFWNNIGGDSSVSLGIIALKRNLFQTKIRKLLEVLSNHL